MRISKNIRKFASETIWRTINMTTMTIAKSPRVFEAEVEELLSMFKTDQISQEEIDCECELVRQNLYANARKE